MVALPLLCKVFDALPADCHVILLGDHEQLASVEPGAVLADIVEALDGPLSPSPKRGTAALRTRGTAKPELLLTSVWERVRQAELDVLSAVTLKELAERHQQLDQQRTLMYHI